MTTLSNSDWRIAETAKSCTSCSATFVPGHEYFSMLLVEGVDDGVALLRKDFCQRCWPNLEHEGAPIFWKTKRPPIEDGQDMIDLAALHGLFVQLLEDEREEVEALRYVVALLLLRKKLLKVVRQGGGARGDLYFKDPRDLEKRVRLPLPDLSPESLERLKVQLGEIAGT